jgi:uncharacterized protein YdaU (DUF1376 family)
VNYYQHHIGDFNAGTVRLSQLERWIYRDMIEVYYDTDQPLPADAAAVCKKIGARGDEQRAIVRELLDDKFVLRDDGYHNERCDMEIEAYRAKSESARIRGKLGGRPRKATGDETETYSLSTANPKQSGSEANKTSLQANQEPLTNNQEPKDKDSARSSNARASRFDARAWLAERGVDPQNANDWLAVRTKKRAANTLTAFEAVAKEAAKAGITLDAAVSTCAARSWVGFEAEWITNRQNALDLAQRVQQNAGPRQSGGYVSKQEQLERNNRAVVERFAARIQAEEAEKGNDDETE